MVLALLKKLVVGTKLEPLARHWWRRLPGAVGDSAAGRYDLQTESVLGQRLRRDANCIDVGCHRGVIMDEILRYCPDGRHIGVEPIPHMAAFLRSKYAGKANVTIVEGALGTEAGTLEFVHNIDNPQTSGLRKRVYPDETNRTERFAVAVRRLDDLPPEGQRVDFIKIDVEGAEEMVLRGGLELIRRWQPIVIFEHGLGAAEVYGSNPGTLVPLFASCGLQVGLMADLIAGRPPLSQAEVQAHFDNRTEYYFAAWNPTKLA